MSNREERDNFIKYYARLFEENPNLEIRKDIIYYGLMKYNLTDDQVSDNNNLLTNKNLEIKFQDDPNLDVYFDSRQPQFLQFKSRNEDYAKCVKMYLSYPQEYMEEAVTKIFTFVSNNNMTSFSKVANKVRADSIVIRIANYDDAKKIINFVNSDEMLSSKANKISPFTYKIGVVGLSYDDRLSYNDTVSMLLTNYFIFLKNNNNLKNASIDNFIDFIIRFYNNVFINKKELQSFIKSDYFNTFIYFDNIGDKLNNFSEVINIVYGVSADLINDDNFEKYYIDCLDEKKTESKKNEYNKAVSENSNTNTEYELLDRFINFALREYGADKVQRIIQGYVDGNTDYITRKEDFRTLFISILPPEKLKSIINNDISIFLNQRYGIKDTHVSISVSQKYNLFINACISTATKYNKGQLIAAINNLMYQNVYNGFTRDDNYRNLLIQYVTQNDVLYFISQYFMQQGLNISKDNCIEEFCNNLYEKYVNKKIYN